MFFNRCFDKDNISNDNGNNMNNSMINNCCSCCEPIMECPQERVCHRQMCYEVPQVSPFM